jgi:hypothetical protein
MFLRLKPTTFAFPVSAVTTCMTLLSIGVFKNEILQYAVASKVFGIAIHLNIVFVIPHWLFFFGLVDITHIGNIKCV